MQVKTKLNIEEIRTVKFLCGYLYNEFKSVNEKKGISDMLETVATLNAKMVKLERKLLNAELDGE